MREKLIEMIQTAVGGCTRHWAEVIADYQIENGVVVLPCEVGQKVWYIRGGYYNSPNKKPCEIEITEINKKSHGKKIDWGFVANGTRYRFSSIGKTVFLSREDAERALRKEDEGK